MSRFLPTVLLAVLVAALLADVPAPPGASADDARARAGHQLYVDPDTQAAAHGFGRIARQPQARWVLDSHSVRTVETTVRRHADAAVAAGRRPVFAVYAIPDRDCDGHAAGGLSGDRAYRQWVRRVADGLLKAAGVARARGFSTNVSNFRSTSAEHAWAKQVRRHLARRGVGGTTYVVDTSRNGARPRSTEWCNPRWARLGKPPRLVLDGPFDGRLWVKHPGESDGPCHGGPAAGVWSDELARRLLR